MHHLIVQIVSFVLAKNKPPHMESIKSNTSRTIKIKHKGTTPILFEEEIWSKYTRLREFAVNREYQDSENAPCFSLNYASDVITTLKEMTRGKEEMEISSSQFFTIIRLLIFLKPMKPHRTELYQNLLFYTMETKNQCEFIPREIIDIKNYSSIQDIELQFWYMFLHASMSKFYLPLRLSGDTLIIGDENFGSDFKIYNGMLSSITKIKVYFSIFKNILVIEHLNLFIQAMNFFFINILNNSPIENKVVEIVYNCCGLTARDFQNIYSIFSPRFDRIMSLAFIDFAFDVGENKVAERNIFDTFLSNFTSLKKLSIKLSDAIDVCAFRNLLKNPSVRKTLIKLEIGSFGHKILPDDVAILISQLYILEELDMSMIYFRKGLLEEMLNDPLKLIFLKVLKV